MRRWLTLLAFFSLALGGLAMPLRAENDSEAADKADDAAPVVYEVTVGDADARYTAIRVSRDLVLIAKGLKKDDVVTLVPASDDKAAKSAKTPPVAGKVIEVTDDLSLARFKQTDLVSAGVKTALFARSQASFGDYVELISRSETQASAMLESSHRLFVFPRADIAISGHFDARGGMLFNGCHQLTGVVPAAKDRSGAVRALTIAQMESLVDDGDGDIERAEKACEGHDDGLDKLADRTRDRADSARKQAATADAAVKDLEAKIAQGQYGRGGKAGAEQRLADLKKEAANARAVADRADDRIDVIEDYRNSHDRDHIFAVLLLVVALALIIVTGVLLRHSRQQVRDRERSISAISRQVDEIDARLDAEPWRDVVLRGPSGLLKINASQLTDGGDGAVIGRSERNADVTFSPPDISRQHARLFVRDGRLWIEDMGSAGGTFVRGRKVEAGAPVSLSSGDELRLAAHVFTVEVQ